MKSSITNCNSNDQLLQLVSIQLLQKTHFRQLMFEGAIISLYSFPRWTEVLTSNVYVRNALLT